MQVGGVSGIFLKSVQAIEKPIESIEYGLCVCVCVCVRMKWLSLFAMFALRSFQLYNSIWSNSSPIGKCIFIVLLFLLAVYFSIYLCRVMLSVCAVFAMLDLLFYVVQCELRRGKPISF